MDQGDGPKPIYAGLIGRLAIGRKISEAEVDRLPDPDLFRDAWMLYQHGTWNAAVLDETDALLLALVRKFQGVKVG